MSQCESPSEWDRLRFGPPRGVLDTDGGSAVATPFVLCVGVWSDSNDLARRQKNPDLGRSYETIWSMTRLAAQ